MSADVIPSDFSCSVEWGLGTSGDEMGSMGMISRNSEDNSEQLNEAISTLDAGVDSSSHWQGLDNWLRDPNDD